MVNTPPKSGSLFVLHTDTLFFISIDIPDKRTRVHRSKGQHGSIRIMFITLLRRHYRGILTRLDRTGLVSDMTATM